ncbi:hypothetical protein EYC84_007777 [Monilinia fructicola]|uniref:Uncharacterized protein n=1 Tax=Monilinia fructicola TaxID=38448 RepID=A0A5M9JLW0_MONFR|nr:hypothetical protein EYC84_007777 [Monilinia fructicola]
MDILPGVGLQAARTAQDGVYGVIVTITRIEGSKSNDMMRMRTRRLREIVSGLIDMVIFISLFVHLRFLVRLYSIALD